MGCASVHPDVLVLGPTSPYQSKFYLSSELYQFFFLVLFLITSPAGAVAKYCDVYVCLCLSVRDNISGTRRAIFTKFLCMLPMSLARSSSGMFTIGRIAYRREGVFFRIENALSAGKGGWECTVQVKYPRLHNLLFFFWFHAVD